MIKILSKTVLFILILIISSSCSETSQDEKLGSSEIITEYAYTLTELETMKLINDYRISIGINPLKRISHLSFKAEEHNNHMISNDNVSHDNFTHRSENIISALKAKRVSENIGYNYKTPQGILNAWLNSPEQKKH
jgi:uncharacterized protein YkwD